MSSVCVCFGAAMAMKNLMKMMRLEMTREEVAPSKSETKHKNGFERRPFRIDTTLVEEGSSDSIGDIPYIDLDMTHVIEAVYHSHEVRIFATSVYIVS